MLKIGRIVFLVKDYDEAIQFYSDILSFKVIMDFLDKEGQRFVHIGLPSQKDIGLWLIKSEWNQGYNTVGNQTLNEPFLVLYTDNFEEIFKRIKENDVKIKIEPFETPQGKVMHFFDLYENEIILVELNEIDK